MAASSRHTSSNQTFREPVKPLLPSLEPIQLALWVDAVTDYARALNNINWFSMPADEREGRLFLEQIPGTSFDLKPEQLSYLIEFFESCIKLCFPEWKSVLKKLKEYNPDQLIKLSAPELKTKVYFCLGRHMVDTFCDPIKQSEKWMLFREELSQKNRDLISMQISNGALEKLVQQQADAMESIVFGAAMYFLLKTWNDQHIPKAEEGTEEGRSSRKKQIILNDLISPLSAVFNDSPVFLLNLFSEYMKKKVCIPLLSLRMGITIEIDDRLLKYVHKSDELSHIQQLKVQLKNELEDKLKEKFKDIESTTSSDNSEMSDKLVSLPDTPPKARPRAASVPATFGVKPSALLKSSLYRDRQTPPSNEKEESKQEDEQLGLH